MEFGVGIHGEPGIDRRPFTSLDQTVDEMFDTLLENGNYSRTLRHWDNVQARGRKVKKASGRYRVAIALLRWSIISARRRCLNSSAYITASKAVVRMQALSLSAT